MYVNKKCEFFYMVRVNTMNCKLLFDVVHALHQLARVTSTALCETELASISASIR
jgi:hypothetical protein